MIPEAIKQRKWEWRSKDKMSIWKENLTRWEWKMREDSGRDGPFNTQAHTLLVLSAFDYGKIMSNLQSSKLSCCYSNKRKTGKYY